MAASESLANGRPLSAVLGRPLPFLVKLIDTAGELSIQVHPDDDVAAGATGKEEAWVVLAADEGARVLAGVRDGVSATAFAGAVRGAVADPARGGDLLALLQPIPVGAGTLIVVPAGTVHAIGSGILLAEIQQPADCTYRFFDYGSGRELHVEAALAVTQVRARPGIWQPEAVPAILRGKHLRLEVLGPGRHSRAAAADEVLIPWSSCRVRPADGRICELAAGALRLATVGLDYVVEVPDRGGAVIGCLGPMVANERSVKS